MGNNQISYIMEIEIDTNEIDTNEIDTDEIDTDEIDTDEIDTDEIDTDEIDNTWVIDYKKTEENYNVFYNEKVNTIKIFFMYINTDKTVVNARQEILTLNNDSILRKEQLIHIIKNNQILNNIKYKLFSIVRYNIDLQPDEINNFLSVSNTDKTYINRFLIDKKNIDDIYFADTITIFQDLNSLYIIFKEQNTNKYLYTQKIKNYLKKNYDKQRHTRHKKYI
jgi:hypothetical protein